MERTLVLIKPDGVKRKLVGEIIKTYEEKGLTIVAIKMLRPSKEIAQEHYEEHKEKVFFNELIEYITEGRVCAMIIQGENVIKLVRKLNGDKDPVKAELGSIRGRFAHEKTRNLVHASDSIEHAEREIKIWFYETRDLFKIEQSNMVEV